MSSEETPKKPRKPRAPKKTSGRDDSNEPTEIVSPASAPMTKKDDKQTETEGQDDAGGSNLQPDSFPPPLTDNRRQTDSTEGIDADRSTAHATTAIVSSASTKTEKKDEDSTIGKDSGAEVIPQSTADEPDSFPPQTTSESTKTDSAVGNDSNSTTQATADENEKNMGNDRLVPSSTGSIRDSELLESLKLSRVRIPGETKSACKERLRMLARNAGLPRGTGPGTAYEWAMNAVIELFAPPPPIPVPPAPIIEETAILESDILSPIGYKSPQVDEPIPVSAPVIEPDVPGLGTIPESWPKLPPNAPLQAEIAWVTANRLVVRSGKGVDLARALSPAPSYSALSWLETSILFPSKFADISVKATADQDTEKEFVRREKMAIEEIRSLLAEMLDAKPTQSK